MSKRGKRWFDLAKDHPVRIWHVFNATRKALQYAKAALDDDWPRSDNWFAARESDIRHAQEKYDDARARWEAAGQPNQNGRKTGAETKP